MVKEEEEKGFGHKMKDVTFIVLQYSDKRGKATNRESPLNEFSAFMLCEKNRAHIHISTPIKVAE